MRREAKFQTVFRSWLKANPIWTSAAFELKQTTKHYINFSEIKEHQIDALLAAKHSCILYKIPDDSRGIKPVDFFYLRAAAAFIVIRYPDFFCLIDIDDFFKEKNKSDSVASLTAPRAIRIAFQVIRL